MAAMNRLHSMLVWSFALVLAIPALADDVEQHLRTQYQGKTLVLRGFYMGKKLQYDFGGTPEGSPKVGEWTNDGFVRVDELRLSKRRLTIKAERMGLNPDYRQGFDLQTSKKSSVEINVSLSDNATGEQIDAVLHRIFLTAHDDLADLVPDAWKGCVAAAELGKDRSCRFASATASAIPGVARRNDSSAGGGSPSNAVNLPHYGGEMTPPKVTVHKEPEFSDEARKSKFQGTVTLGLTVNEQGLPTNVHIIAPLGHGLDAKAVEAVRTWRFDPARKGGQPVSVAIQVQVDFHLY